MPFFLLQHEKNEWSSTVLSVDDNKPARLPIVDVEVRDVGTRNQRFKIEVGQVCFA